MSQLTTRDYKGAARREGGPSGGLKEFLLGALAGALLAGFGTALVMHHEYRSRRTCTAAATSATASPAAPTPAPAPRRAAPPAAAARTTPAPQVALRTASAPRIRRSAHPQSGPAQPQYDFYQMLPNLKVIVPRPTAPGAHAAGVRGAAAYGGYVLQVGSYSDAAQAERIISELDSVGIIAHVDTVQSRGVTLHRVRIGPITEASELARIRGTLHALRLPAIVIPGAVH
ncbi:MAG: SPOR domain-containing protein [Pseudomonadota bacterium]|jgi:cell division protein FtsN|nr:SPOR domain-containing protein [Pseudomonadota bacterium]